MREIHPFRDFIPNNAWYLIIGSFIGRRMPEDARAGFDWFYGTKRNQFWPIMERVYGVSLKTKREKEQFLKKLKMSMTDIIYSCERLNNSNLDVNLINIVLNTGSFNKIFGKKKIEKVFFTSRFVENLFRKNFNNLILKHPEIEFI